MDLWNDLDGIEDDQMTKCDDFLEVDRRRRH